MHTLIFLCLFSLPNVLFVFVSFYVGTKTRDLLRVGGLLFSKRRALFFCVCSGKKDRRQKTRNVTVVCRGVLFLVSALSSVARAFPLCVLRRFQMCVNYLVPFSSFSV